MQDLLVQAFAFIFFISPTSGPPTYHSSLRTLIPAFLGQMLCGHILSLHVEYIHPLILIRNCSWLSSQMSSHMWAITPCPLDDKLVTIFFHLLGEPYLCCNNVSADNHKLLGPWSFCAPSGLQLELYMLRGTSVPNLGSSQEVLFNFIS